MIKIILLILLSEIWDLTGQILFKKSVNDIDVSSVRTIPAYFNFIKNVLKKPKVWLGIVCVGMGIVIWLSALAQTDLSIAFPIDSMQYVLTLIAAALFLGEKMDKDKLLGTLLVAMGILFVVQS